MNLLHFNLVTFIYLTVRTSGDDAVIAERNYEHEPYNVDPYITCHENNIEIPLGYRDPSYADPDNILYVEGDPLNDLYMTTGEHPGRGDVCDHADSEYKDFIRDSCFFQVTFGAVIDEEKTWSFKCRYHESCPLTDDEGNTVMGCHFGEKRITCCCNHKDFCNDYPEWAKYGNPEYYPVNVSAIDTDLYTFTVPDELTNSSSSSQEESNEESDESESEETGDCTVGYETYSNGDTIDYIGYTCTGDVTFTGVELKCIDGIEIEEPFDNGDCSAYDGNSICCQEGEENTPGGAVCITEQCYPYEPPPSGECIVGDIMYQNGDSIGVLGDICIDEGDKSVSFSGTESFCRDGNIVEEPYEGDCPTDTWCCQEREPGTGGGAAVCISRECVPYDYIPPVDESVEQSVEQSVESVESTDESADGDVEEGRDNGFSQITSHIPCGGMIMIACPPNMECSEDTWSPTVGGTPQVGFCELRR